MNSYPTFEEAKKTFKIDLKAFKGYYCETSGELQNKLEQLKIIPCKEQLIDYNAEILCLIYNDLCNGKELSVSELEELLETLYDNDDIYDNHIFDLVNSGTRRDLFSWEMLQLDEFKKRFEDYDISDEDTDDLGESNFEWDEFGDTYPYIWTNSDKICFIG